MPHKLETAGKLLRSCGEVHRRLIWNEHGKHWKIAGN